MRNECLTRADDNTSLKWLTESDNWPEMTRRIKDLRWIQLWCAAVEHGDACGWVVHLLNFVKGGFMKPVYSIHFWAWLRQSMTHNAWLRPDDESLSLFRYLLPNWAFLPVPPEQIPGIAARYAIAFLPALLGQLEILNLQCMKSEPGQVHEWNCKCPSTAGG